MRYLALATTSLLLAAAPSPAVAVIIFGIDLSPASGSPVDAPLSQADRASFDAISGGAVLVEDYHALGAQRPNVAPFARPTAMFADGMSTVLAGADQADAWPTMRSPPRARRLRRREDWRRVDSLTPPSGPIDPPSTVSACSGSAYLWSVYDLARAVEAVSGGLPLNVGSGAHFMDDLVIGVIAAPEPVGLALRARRGWIAGPPEALAPGTTTLGLG